MYMYKQLALGKQTDKKTDVVEKSLYSLVIFDCQSRSGGDSEQIQLAYKWSEPITGGWRHCGQIWNYAI